MTDAGGVPRTRAMIRRRTPPPTPARETAATDYCLVERIAWGVATSPPWLRAPTSPATSIRGAHLRVHAMSRSRVLRLPARGGGCAACARAKDLRAARGPHATARDAFVGFLLGHPLRPYCRVIWPGPGRRVSGRRASSQWRATHACSLCRSIRDGGVRRRERVSGRILRVDGRSDLCAASSADAHRQHSGDACHLLSSTDGPSYDGDEYEDWSRGHVAKCAKLGDTSYCGGRQVCKRATVP